MNASASASASVQSIQPLRAPEERARAIDAVLDASLYAKTGGVLWRGSQLARAPEHRVDTGHATLSAALPGGGWPLGALIELMTPQPGIGELRLLRPALAALSGQPLMLLTPPHLPNQQALAHWGLPIEPWHIVRATRSADALWAAEQILRAGSCGALLFWHDPIRQEALRRLHLAAQSSRTLFCLFRPHSAAHQTSPAPLRLSLRPAAEGLHIQFIKRRGPLDDTPLFVSLQPSPYLLQRSNDDPRADTVPVRREYASSVVVD